MTEVVQFESARGPVLVEVEPAEIRGLRLVSKGDGSKVAKATETFDKAIGDVVASAGDLLDKLRDLAPDSAALEFGVKLSGEMGGIFAKASGEGHINVTLTWNSPGKSRQ